VYTVPEVFEPLIWVVAVELPGKDSEVPVEEVAEDVEIDEPIEMAGSSVDEVVAMVSLPVIGVVGFVPIDEAGGVVDSVVVMLESAGEVVAELSPPVIGVVGVVVMVVTVVSLPIGGIVAFAFSSDTAKATTLPFCSN